jgi:magnesium transporter
VAPPQRVDRVRITVIGYTPQGYEELEIESVEEAPPILERSKVTWLNVVGLHDVELLRKIAERFALHPLAMEDVVNLGQRPGTVEYDDHAFISMRLVHIRNPLDVEQVSIFLAPGLVISFQEIPDDDPFDPVRERIRKGGGNIRRRGSDYLAYALVDCLVDSLYPVLETYGDAIELLESQLLGRSLPGMMDRIQKIKRDLLWIRRVAWPHREAVAALGRLEGKLVSDDTRHYLRDSYDHTVQIMDVVETLRELVSSLTDLHLSQVSNRMNEVMKVLTVMASIFIPLTFIAGIYGMNFNPDASPLNMPELNWFWGYPSALVLMGSVGGGMLLFFKRKGWI